jgi:hypothetical protein
LDTTPDFATGGQFTDATANPAAAGPGDRPDVTEAATGPDLTEAATDPDLTQIAGGPRAAGPGYGPDVPTRRSVDFAAAPIWDLAATDVFPVAPPQPPDDEAPGAS